MQTFHYSFFSVLFVFVILMGCRKDDVYENHDATLNFSTDTIFFDTILSSIGSPTQRFKVFNPYKEKIIIQDIYLAGGSSSEYRLNVDGMKGYSHSDIEIAPKDSIFIFVEVTIDPKNSNSPLVISDSIIFVTNGNTQQIKLVAFGQDVNLFAYEVFKSQTWTAGKPYFIYGAAALDSNEVLTIEPGTVIYLHNQASLQIWGQLDARGTLENPIILTGSRFDGNYEESSGQWGTLFFHPKSKNNILEYVIIKNSIAGIQVGLWGKDEIPDVELRNCMILNASAFGIYAFGAKITAYNTIISDCGQSLAIFLNGGIYNFYHCTLSNVSSYFPGYYSGGYAARNFPSLYYSNFFEYYDLDNYYRIIEVTYKKPLECNFYNSIISGTLAEEIKFAEDKDESFDYKFDHCLLKNHKDSLDYSNTQHFISILLNADPGFIHDSISLGPYDFQLDSLSPALDTGSLEIIQEFPQLQTDFNGKSRLIDGKPDLGAYEMEK